MPKIEWTKLPPALRDHLFDRLAERKITAEDLYQLKLWRDTEPEAPEGLWYRTLDHSRSAVKAASLRRSFCADRLQEEKPSSSKSILSIDSGNHSSVDESAGGSGNAKAGRLPWCSRVARRSSVRMTSEEKPARRRLRC